jgi:hypothetical protein
MIPLKQGQPLPLKTRKLKIAVPQFKEDNP